MYYTNQKVLLASMHQKEQAIAPPFFNRLSCTLSVHDFDTDQFGTFSGEIARTLSPYETCLLKAKSAAMHYDYAYALASEGSFGPHPAFPFIPRAHELMVFIDTKHDWIIAEQLVSQKTNFAMIKIHELKEIDAFLQRVHFPSHALMVQAASSGRLIVKGVSSFEVLTHHLIHGLKQEEELIITTDMRAMMNPTRMEMIGELADKLAIRIATLCKLCGCPGFGFKSTRGALPCSLCQSATSFYQEEVWGCVACDHEEYKMRQDGLTNAEPTHCDYCNP